MFPVVPNLLFCCSPSPEAQVLAGSTPISALRLPGEQLEQLATQSVAGGTKCCWRVGVPFLLFALAFALGGTFSPLLGVPIDVSAGNEIGKVWPLDRRPWPSVPPT